MTLVPWRELHPLEGVIYKIWWAQKHLETIDKNLGVYESLHPHRVICELNTDETFYECRWQAIMPPPLDIGLLIGEFAYQLRSTLDQIIFALSSFPPELSAKELESAERSTGFPIYSVRNDTYIKGRLLKYVRAGIQNRVWEIVDDLQPYQRGDNAENDFLAILEELNIRDKHRILKPTGVILHINETNLAEGIEIIIAGSVNSGDIIARVPAPLDLQKDFYPRISVEEVIQIPRPAGGIYITALSSIYQRVRDGVLPRFLGFFPPLPPDLESVRSAF